MTSFVGSLTMTEQCQHLDLAVDAGGATIGLASPTERPPRDHGSLRTTTTTATAYTSPL